MQLRYASQEWAGIHASLSWRTEGTEKGPDQAAYRPRSAPRPSGMNDVSFDTLVSNNWKIGSRQGGVLLTVTFNLPSPSFCRLQRLAQHSGKTQKARFE